MQEIRNFIYENRNGFLATVADGKPKVRPFAFKFEEEGRYYFCTSKAKEVYKQLVDCPSIEFSTVSKELVTLRMSGEIEFVEDLDVKERVVNTYDNIKSIYKTGDNPMFALFYLEHGKALIFDIKGGILEKREF